MATLKKQVAALPYRTGNGVEILVMTSRETRRTVIPKGGRMKGLKPWEAAAREAEEEDGLRGKIGKHPIGTYSYWKRRTDHFDLCEVAVYPLRVTKQLKAWKERNERQQRWLTAEDAAILVDEPQLASLIREWAKNVRATRNSQPLAMKSTRSAGTSP